MAALKRASSRWLLASAAVVTSLVAFRQLAARASADPITPLPDHRGLITGDGDALSGAVSALTMLADARDSSVDLHALVVADLARWIAIELGCRENEVVRIGIAARLHDIGKIAIPDSILEKPGPLTETERSVMQRHPVLAAEALASMPALQAIAPLARSHHERWDGTGYPDGLSAEKIPLGARIIAVADAFDAMVSDRPYSHAMTPDAALAELQACACSQFDERVVEAMEGMLSFRPVSREAAHAYGSGEPPCESDSKSPVW